jgi:cytochrome P450
VLVQYGLEWLPSKLIYSLSYLPITKLYHFVTAGRKIARISKDIIQEKTDACVKGLEGGKDLMSLLVRANLNEKPSARLSDVEVISEIACVCSSLANITGIY